MKRGIGMTQTVGKTGKIPHESNEGQDINAQKIEPSEELFDDEALEATQTRGDMAAFDRAFGLAAFAMNRFIVDHLLRFGRHFGADYPMLLVWGVVAHQSLIGLIPMGSMPSQLLNEEGMLSDPQPALRAVRVRDLCQITGIPKETVRRKLLKLSGAGWIAQQGEGWVINRETVVDLRDFTRESMTRLLSTADHVRSLLKDAAGAPKP
jgi:hypothetical protein